MNLGAEWWWLILAAVLALAELVASGVFLVWVAMAAALTGLVVLASGIALPFQLGLFALFTIASVYQGRRVYERTWVPSSDPLLNDRTGRLIGQSVTVVSAIEHGQGRVKVGDGVWDARGDDAPVGARVRIVGAQGTCLTVEPLAAPPPAPEPHR